MIYNGLGFVVKFYFFTLGSDECWGCCVSEDSEELLVRVPFLEVVLNPGWVGVEGLCVLDGSFIEEL